MSRLLRGLPAQLLLITILPLAVILIVVSLGSVALHQEAMRSMVAERDLRTAVATAKVLGGTLQRKQDALKALAEHISPTMTTITPKAIQDALSLNTHEFPGGVAVFGRDGRLIARTPSAASWSVDPATSRNLLERASIMPPVPITDSGALFLVTPISGGEAFLASRVPIAALSLGDMVEQDSSHANVTAFLFDSAGRVLYRTANALLADDVRGHAGVEEALQGRQGVVYTSDATSDGEHVVSYVPIATREGLAGLGLIIEEPWQAVVNPLMQYSLALPLITLPVLLLALLAVVFGIRRIVQPLHSLQKRARLAGAGNFSALSAHPRAATPGDSTS